MKKLCVLILLLPAVVSSLAQRDNHILHMVEDAVIEYYDTLLTHTNYRLQKFQRRELLDTNIYLYLNCIDERLFMENLHKPDGIPKNIFFHTIGKYQFIKRGSIRSPEVWSTCRLPKASKARQIEVIKISYVDVQADTILIHLTHCYYSKSTERIHGRCVTADNWAISGGTTWKYVFSEESRNWICIKKTFGEI